MKLYVWQRTGMLSKFWWTNLKDGNHVEVVSAGGRIILKCTLKKMDRKAVTKLM
jgi:hypothetical protein